MSPEEKKQKFTKLIEHSNQKELLWFYSHLQKILGVSRDLYRIPFSNLSIIYITDTGNAKKVATEIFDAIKSKGIPCTLKSSDAYTEDGLKNETHLLIVVSTTGDGEVPDSGKQLIKHLAESKPNLSKLSYAIIALGDSSYAKFCDAGHQIEGYLKSLDAEPFLPMQKVDGAIDYVAHSWLSALSRIKKTNGKGSILKNEAIGIQESDKTFHHLEIEIDLDYEPGDTIKYVPKNSDDQVQAVLETFNIDKDEQVDYRKESVSIQTLLKEKLSINRLTRISAKKYLRTIGLEPKDEQLADLLDQSILQAAQTYPPQNVLEAKDLVNILTPISARYYSIASCPITHNGQIHLTVAKHSFEVNGKHFKGLASTQLTALNLGDTQAFSVYPNDRFRLPKDDRDIIMIGPGTGIAPFRSFLYHRKSTGSKGKNWLFFGGQRSETDFLYQHELKAFKESGHLFRLDAAFSRDQTEKIYVQQLIQKQADLFLTWLDLGACLYICGNKIPMSEDVEEAIVQLICEGKGWDRLQTKNYLKEMLKNQRYLKDVY